MARLPIPGSDDGSWGDILNAYLLQSLTADGSIKTGVVGTPQLADNAVTSAKLAPSAVTTSHLSTGSVTNSAIADGAIAQGKIANLSGDLAGKADSVHTHTASQLSDATTAGRSLITAADATAQRTALGLGSAATLTVGTTAGTVAAGDDSRLTGALQASGLDAATAALVGNSASATGSSLTSTFARRYPSAGAAAVLRSLTRGARPVSIAVCGDSTGNETTEWVYGAAGWLGSRYPAWTTHYRLWSDTAQSWAPETVISTGAAGEAYMLGDGSAARGFTSPDSARLSVTGDISVRVKFRPTASWASGAAQCLAAKFGGGGERAWRFEVTSTGYLYMEISPDGTTQYGKTSTAVVPFSFATDGWVRVDVDVDNGASGWGVLFYTSADGVTWTQLGTTVTTATATSIFDNTFAVHLGMRNGSAPVNGRLYAVDIFNGISASSPLVASWRAGEMYQSQTSAITGTDCAGNAWTASAAVAGIVGAPVLTILNASVAGAALGYFTDATRLAKILAGRVRMVMASLSHNHGGLYYEGDAYFAPFVAWIAQMRVIVADLAVVIVGQNPEVSPASATSIASHRDRVRELATVAAIGGHGFIDVYAAFEATGNAAALLNPADGVHPTTDGQAVWLVAVQTFFTANA